MFISKIANGVSHFKLYKVCDNSLPKSKKYFYFKHLHCSYSNITKSESRGLFGISSITKSEDLGKLTKV